MRRPAKSFWLASLLVFATLFACATDDEVAFEPGVEDLIVYRQDLTHGSRSPTLSQDARVLAWIRATGYAAGTQYCVVRWERPAPIDTTYYCDWPFGELAQIDLSDDGRHLVGLLWQGDKARFFLKSEDGGNARLFDVPSDYTEVKAPRWEHMNQILFGALGPGGQGIWCWNPVDDSITRVCVRFPNPVGQWVGTCPDLDRQGKSICLERRIGGWRNQTIICSVDSGEILLDLDGRVPHFWTITPTEEDGLLYIDSHRTLRGVRLSRNESFYIVQEISEYDISADGRWLFVKDSALNLKLLDLRDLR